MKWTVELGQRSVLVELPDRLPPAGVMFNALIDGQSAEVAWDPASKTLSLNTATSPARPIFRSLSCRSARVSFEPQNGCAEIAGEFTSGHQVRSALAARVSPYSPVRAGRGGAGAHQRQTVTSPMDGKVVRILVTAGEPVEKNQTLFVVEAMKMENRITAPVAGRVGNITAVVGGGVKPRQVLATIEPIPAEAKA